MNLRELILFTLFLLYGAASFAAASLGGFLLIADSPAWADRGVHVGLTPRGMGFALGMILCGALPGMVSLAWAARKFSDAVARDRAESQILRDINTLNDHNPI